MIMVMTMTWMMNDLGDHDLGFPPFELRLKNHTRAEQDHHSWKKDEQPLEFSLHLDKSKW